MLFHLVVCVGECSFVCNGVLVIRLAAWVKT